MCYFHQICPTISSWHLLVGSWCNDRKCIALCFVDFWYKTLWNVIFLTVQKKPAGSLSHTAVARSDGPSFFSWYITSFLSPTSMMFPRYHFSFIITWWENNIDNSFMKLENNVENVDYDTKLVSFNYYFHHFKSYTKHVYLHSQVVCNCTVTTIIRSICIHTHTGRLCLGLFYSAVVTPAFFSKSKLWKIGTKFPEVT